MSLGSEEMIKIMVAVQNGMDPPSDESEEAREFREGLTAEMKTMEEFAEANGLSLIWEMPAEFPGPF